ncbi:MAG TPA: hypothetical protein VHM70_09295 [Polyangiaceae bacterium]|jgi:hypothetical protein|nr:hypothetical protein [Polyangiaceae bacterium]
MSKRLTSLGEFLAVGGATLFILPALVIYRRQVGLEHSEALIGMLMFHAAMFINNPHFLVSYLLFYRRGLKPAWDATLATLQRWRFRVAGLFVPLALMAWLGNALWAHSAQRLGLAMQLMFVLVGWHYVKQGFGVVMVLSARRGVHFSKLERRLVLAHCLAGWLFARTHPADPGRLNSLNGVLYTSLPHPHGLDQVTRVGLWLSIAGLLWAVISHVRRRRALPPIGPFLGFLVTVWCWTIGSRWDPLFVYVIPALHGAQYLYFVALWRVNQVRALATDARAPRLSFALGGLFFGSLVLGWLAFRALPEFLDSRFVLLDEIDPLGPTPHLAALSVFINVHHYFIDAVMWRRESPDARFVMLRSPDPLAQRPSGGGRWGSGEHVPATELTEAQTQ